MTVPVPLTDIEAAAREATPGPWALREPIKGFGRAVIAGTRQWPDGSPRDVVDEALDEDAAHIASADPPTVLALCKALRIAVEALDECGCYAVPAMPRGYFHYDALAAVRELVDLGGDDG